MDIETMLEMDEDLAYHRYNVAERQAYEDLLEEEAEED